MKWIKARDIIRGLDLLTFFQTMWKSNDQEPELFEEPPDPTVQSL